MERKAITNDTLMPIYVNGVMIPPGETRHFDAENIPPEHREAPAKEEEAPAPDRIAEIVLMSAALIIAVLADLSDEDLSRLLLIEQEGKKRKTVVEAIAVQQLKRAQEKLSTEGSESTGGGQTTTNPEGSGAPGADQTNTNPEGGASTGADAGQGAPE